MSSNNGPFVGNETSWERAKLAERLELERRGDPRPLLSLSTRKLCNSCCNKLRSPNWFRKLRVNSSLQQAQDTKLAQEARD
jgi:hypothetical protein